MTRLSSLLASLILCAPALAADGADRSPSPTSADAHSVVLFLDARPYSLRLHLGLDGKPFMDRWESLTNRLFEYADWDRDGRLDADEMKRLPDVATLQRAMLGNAYGVGGQLARGPTLPTGLDQDKDGKITPAEWRDYLARHGCGPLQPAANPYARSQTNQATDLLFTLLDTDRNGRLSKQELAAATTVLARLDLDDDESLSLLELQQDAGPYGGGFVQAVPGGPNPSAATPLLVIQRESAPTLLTERLRAARAVIDRLDRDKDGKLSAVESGFPRDQFVRLDVNRDGVLSAEELLRWLIVEPDLVLAVQLGKVEVAERGLVRLDAKGTVESSRDQELSPNGSLSLLFGKTRVDFRRADAFASGRVMNYGNYFKQLFRAVDRENRGYLTEKDLNAPNAGFIRQYYPQADENGDGKLTEKELEAYFALIAGAFGCQASMTIAEVGKGLFESLDADGDGRISSREMRDPWKRLVTFDLNNDGAMERSELPRQYQIAMVAGAPNYASMNRGMMMVRAPGGGLGPPRAQAPQRGPLWFRKMDHNADGEVSAREFLGSLEDFRRIDADGDGYLSPDEAERADVALRARKQ